MLIPFFSNSLPVSLSRHVVSADTLCWNNRQICRRRRRPRGERIEKHTLELSFQLENLSSLWRRHKAVERRTFKLSLSLLCRHSSLCRKHEIVLPFSSFKIHTKNHRSLSLSCQSKGEHKRELASSVKGRNNNECGGGNASNS